MNISERTLKRWRKDALEYESSHAVENKIFDRRQQRTWLKEICANCGCTYGSHHGGTSPWPRDYCPGTEGRMDWKNGPGTVFKHSGEYKEGDE